MFKKKKEQSVEFEIKSYSPMTKIEKIIYFFLIMFGFGLIVRYLSWWLTSEHIPTNWIVPEYPILHVFDYILFGVLTFAVFIGLFLRLGSWFTIWFMKRPYPVVPSSNYRVAFITCYVPGAEPIDMLEETLLAMRDAEYEHDTWVLDEGNQSEVKDLCIKLGVKHFSRKDSPHYNLDKGHFRKRTKAGNLNAWRNEYEEKYDIIAQVDMDHVPYKDYLIKQLGYFQDPKVGFVGVPQVYKNTENWIAKGSAEQTYYYYGPMQQGFYGSHMPFLIGTTHVYRVKAMKGFGGYAPSITEDYLTGLHFFSHGWKGVYVPEVVAEGHGPVSWAGYFNQQMRWSYGLFEILFKHSYRHFFKLTIKQKINLFFSQLYYFSGLTTFFGVLLVALYLFFGIESTNMDVVEWILYSFPAYLSGLTVLLFLHKYYIDPKKNSPIGLRGLFLSQAANVIYTLALFKFLTRSGLSYRVTPKAEGEKSRAVSLNIFSIHILIILLCIFGLQVSFILDNASPVMRFWAFYIIIIFSLMVASAYWKNFIRSLSRVLSNKIFIKKRLSNNY